MTAAELQDSQAAYPVVITRPRQLNRTLAKKTVNGHNRLVVQILRRKVATQDKQSQKVGDSVTDHTQNLRERAESALGHHATQLLHRLSSELPSAAVRHELLVHQIELEMQNDELRLKQAEIDISNARWL
jgi:hypothetical protein